MTAGRPRGAGAGLLCLPAVVLGCTLDLSPKHDCRRPADCTGNRVCVAGTCQPPDTVDGAIPSPNYVFVTSAAVAIGSLNVAGADQTCAAAAAAAQLPGQFRAWLSTSTTDALDRLQGARGWVRPDGAPFADTLADIAAGRIFNAAFLDENGARVSGLVITGTAVNGRVDRVLDCDDWSAGATGRAIAGTTDGTTGVWTYFTTLPCSEPARLYCFGVDHFTTVAPSPPRGKIAFLSNDPFLVGGGLAAADAQCQDEAAGAGLAGEFRALLSAPGLSAASRVQVNRNVLWSRVDGVPISRAGADILFDATVLLAPLNVTSQKRYMDASVFTGATGPNAAGDPPQTCGSWMAGSSATAGRANYLPWWFATGDAEPCTSHTAAIYCFQSD